MTQSPEATVKAALVDEFGLSPEDAEFGARYPDIREFVEEILAGRRKFAEAMAELDRATERRREALRRALAESRRD